MSIILIFYKTIVWEQKKRILSLFFIFLPFLLWGQTPEIKVDLNQAGRSRSEVNQHGYQGWTLQDENSESKTFKGVNVTFSVENQEGFHFKTDWYKAGIHEPYYAKLISDGITVDDKAAGNGIVMTLRGLGPGKHTLLVFLNVVQSAKGNTFSPLNIYVNGELKVSHLKLSVRGLSKFNASTAYLTIHAVKGKIVKVLFKPSSDSKATVKNVIINGFELNTPNIKEQARNPLPENGNNHVQIKDKNATLKWSTVNGAEAHDLYFGTDSVAVADADHSSPFYKGRMTYPFYSTDTLKTLGTYYWRVDELRKGRITKGNIWRFRLASKAFKGAQGYGRYARGGKGGKVVYVTNLKDRGRGSLRAAVENDIGPRTIVFNVSGLITLESRLNVTDPYVTIAGQTAPGKGICIRHATFGVTGDDDVIRFLRVRLGKPNVSYGGMGLTGNNFSIIDHCSISWTMDESFSSRNARNITLQRTLISEALNVAGHHNYPPGTAHGYAASIGGNVGSFHHNLLADCYGRNWSMAGGLDANAFYAGRLDIRNNVVYNWGTRATDGGANEVNFVNNYYKPGPGTTFFYALNAQHEGAGKGMQRYYFKGNVMPGVFDEKNEKRGRKSSDHEVNYNTFVDHPFFASHVSTQTAENGYKNVLSDVGCNMPVLDKHDVRIINETLNNTTSVTGSVSGLQGFPDNQSDAGGWEDYPEVHRSDHWDSDNDGLPDWWEDIHGLNPHSPEDDFSDANMDEDNDGATNLNDYLNWMADPHACSPGGKPIEIDLGKLTRGYTNQPVFTVEDRENGQVEINDDKAVFTPNQKGLSSFKFTVKDASGDTMTRTVNIVSGYDVKFK